MAEQNFRVKRGLEVGVGATVLTATQNGFVGIGSTNPTSKLDVVGDFKITGVITATTFNGQINAGVSTLGVSTFTGAVSFGTSAFFGDNDKLYFGDGGDLEIYHSGTFSYIKDVGTGSLVINSNAVQIKNAADTETIAYFGENGQVELYYDNVKEFETTGYGATVFGTLQSQGLQVSGASTFSQLINSDDGLNVTGHTELDNLNVSGVSTFQSGNLKIRNPANTFEYSIVGSALSTNHNLTLPLITSNTGIAVTGLNQTFTGTQTFSGINASGSLSLSGSSAGTHIFGTNQTTATIVIGGGSGTGIVTFGRSTASQRTDIQAAATSSGNTKTINLGTGGLSGSFTQINIGPTAGVGTIAINSGTRLGIGSTTPTSALDVIGDAKVSGIVTATEFHTGESGSAIRISNNIISGPSEFVIDPAAVGDNTGAVRIKGDLYVDGTQFIVNSGVIDLADLRVGIATAVTSNVLLDGGGIGIGSTNVLKTFTYNYASDSLKSSENLDIASGKTFKIDGTDVLSSTTLGTGVTASSLTQVGTLDQLSVAGNLNVTTDTTLTGTLVVNNQSTFNHNVTLNGANKLFSIQNGSAAPKFEVDYDNGNTTIYGQLNVQGAVDLDSTLNVDGGVSFGSTLGVTGNATFAADLAVDIDTLKVDSANDRVGVNQATPLYPLDVVGDINSSTAVKVNGVSVVQSAVDEALALAIALG